MKYMDVASTTPERGATGPRTVAGKRRSRMNAIKHGMFCERLVLAGEDRAEYEKLHRDLWHDWRPVGVREILEVEHQTLLYWRRRWRGAIAEVAVISQSPGFVGTVNNSDLPNPHFLRACLKNGAAPVGAKIELLRKALDGLHELAQKLGKRELDGLAVLATLQTIDVKLIEGPFSILYQKIVTLLLANGSACETRDCNSTEAAEFDSKIVQEIKAQGERLLQLLRDEESKDAMYTSLASLIPASNDLERIIRYESHNSREIDRSNKRLEAMQRARRSRSSAIRADLES
jgi:hypothetical protein